VKKFAKANIQLIPRAVGRYWIVVKNKFNFFNDQPSFSNINNSGTIIGKRILNGV